MSTLISLRQNTIGQFTCAMRGHHSISIQDEELLYKDNNEKIQTKCNYCGIRVIAKIDPKHESVYILSRYKEAEE